jgi:peptidoglycan/LPS O-acetylase OafA/YrhL
VRPVLDFLLHAEPSLRPIKNIMERQPKIRAAAFAQPEHLLQAATMVTMNVLSRTNLHDDYMHSVLISLLRGLAALEVAAAHLRAQLYPGYAFVTDPTAWFQALAFVTGFAHQAVVIFFLLSGWLVGGSLLNKNGSDNAIKHYAIDRLTRLWIVLVPTFVLILLFAILAGKIDPHVASAAAGNEYSIAAFLGNLSGLQNLVVPTFGGNFPLWSLSNETWYYVMFPLLVVAATARSGWKRGLAALGIGGLFWFLSGPILLYFTIWLMGAGCSRIKINASAAMRCLFFAVFVLVSVYFRMRGKNDDMGPESFLPDYLFGVAFLLFLASMQYQLPLHSPRLMKMKRVGKFFADFSFTLYVLHIPLIGVVVYLSPYLAANRLFAGNPVHLALYLGIYCAIVVAAYVFHLPFEANTHRLRNYLKRLAVPQKSAIRT